MEGLFITIEGPDGAGKSTQIAFIESYLKEKNIPLIITREPGGTKISEKIRKIILDKENKEMSYETEAFLYAAARAQHVTELIKPTLKEGTTVICDRFVDSSIAYQGYGRKLGQMVEKINDYAVLGLKPDLTLLLKLEAKKGIDRIENCQGEEIEKDRLESEAITFHDEVLKGYIEIEKKYPNRVKGIDASKSIDEVSMDIKKYLDELLGAKYGI